MLAFFTSPIAERSASFSVGAVLEKGQERPTRTHTKRSIVAAASKRAFSTSGVKSAMPLRTRGEVVLPVTRPGCHCASTSFWSVFLRCGQISTSRAIWRAWFSAFLV